MINFRLGAMLAFLLLCIFAGMLSNSQVHAQEEATIYAAEHKPRHMLTAFGLWHL